MSNRDSNSEAFALLQHSFHASCYHNMHHRRALRRQRRLRKAAERELQMPQLAASRCRLAVCQGRNNSRLHPGPRASEHRQPHTEVAKTLLTYLFSAKNTCSLLVSVLL